MGHGVLCGERWRKLVLLLFLFVTKLPSSHVAPRLVFLLLSECTRDTVAIVGQGLGSGWRRGARAKELNAVSGVVVTRRRRAHALGEHVTSL